MACSHDKMTHIWLMKFKGTVQPKKDDLLILSFKTCLSLFCETQNIFRETCGLVTKQNCCKCLMSTSPNIFTNCDCFTQNSWDLLYITISGLLLELLPGNNTSMTSDELRRMRTLLSSHHEVLVFVMTSFFLTPQYSSTH